MFKTSTTSTVASRWFLALGTVSLLVSGFVFFGDPADETLKWCRWILGTVLLMYVTTLSLAVIHNDHSLSKVITKLRGIREYLSIGVVACVAILALSLVELAHLYGNDHLWSGRGIATMVLGVHSGALLFLAIRLQKPKAIRMERHEVWCRHFPKYHFSVGGVAEPLRSSYPAEETITHSAIRHPDGPVFSVECPGRHHHVIRLMSELGCAGMENTHDAGFITSHGRYVGRAEALLIATKASQLIRKTNPQDELFSEDVWDTPNSHRDTKLP